MSAFVNHRNEVVLIVPSATAVMNTTQARKCLDEFTEAVEAAEKVEKDRAIFDVPDGTAFRDENGAVFLKDTASFGGEVILWKIADDRPATYATPEYWAKRGHKITRVITPIGKPLVIGEGS